MAYQLWDVKKDIDGEKRLKVIAKDISYDDFMLFVASAMGSETKIEWWLTEDKEDGFHIKTKFIWQRH